MTMRTTHHAKISKRTVDALAAPATGEAILWDSDIKGFFVRAYPTGRKVYGLRYRWGRLQRTFTIGPHGSPWTPEAARDRASEALARVRLGEDPAAEHRARRDALTVGQLIDLYLLEGPKTKPAKRETTWDNDRSNLDRHIRPLIGTKIANLLTKAEAAKAIGDITLGRTAKDIRTGPRGRARITGGSGVARRTRTTTAAMFAWGMEHGHVSQNPFAGVKLTTPKKRERFLSAEEAGRLLDALTALEKKRELAPGFADAIRLLMLTGARKTEVLGLTWEEVDLDLGSLTLPPERTKAGGSTGERRIRLSPPAVELLARRRAAAKDETPKSPFVFPAASGEGHAVGLRRPFVKACTAAGLTGVRVHDLRHSFASLLIARGASLYLVSKMLGHASARTTERYAHLGDDPQAAAARDVGAVLMVDRQEGEVIDLRSVQRG
jgi:integrase